MPVNRPAAYAGSVGLTDEIAILDDCTHRARPRNFVQTLVVGSWIDAFVEHRSALCSGVETSHERSPKTANATLASPTHRVSVVLGFFVSKRIGTSDKDAAMNNP